MLLAKLDRLPGAESGQARTAAVRMPRASVAKACLDRERTRRLAQLSAVQAAFAGRRRGFRRARKGPELNRLLAIVDELALTLTAPR
ncbi:hypothetical protein ACFCY8_25400 [Streptomyces noursei]|uniref:hypothetical protein n=1 Tax=Streptomyces noursei TaxID=1971 RepID=UPI0035DCA8CA